MKGETNRKGRRKRKRQRGQWTAKRSEDKHKVVSPGRIHKMAKAGFARPQIAKRLGVSMEQVNKALKG